MVPDFMTVIMTINRIMTSVQLSLQTPQSEEITCNHLAGLYILPSLLSNPWCIMSFSTLVMFGIHTREKFDSIFCLVLKKALM